MNINKGLSEMPTLLPKAVPAMLYAIVMVLGSIGLTGCTSGPHEVAPECSISMLNPPRYSYDEMQYMAKLAIFLAGENGTEPLGQRVDSLTPFEVLILHAWVCGTWSEGPHEAVTLPGGRTLCIPDRSYDVYNKIFEAVDYARQYTPQDRNSNGAMDRATFRKKQLEHSERLVKEGLKVLDEHVKYGWHSSALVSDILQTLVGRWFYMAPERRAEAYQTLCGALQDTDDVLVRRNIFSVLEEFPEHMQDLYGQCIYDRDPLIAAAATHGAVLQGDKAMLTHYVGLIWKYHDIIVTQWKTMIYIVGGPIEMDAYKCLNRLVEGISNMPRSYKAQLAWLDEHYDKLEWDQAIEKYRIRK